MYCNLACNALTGALHKSAVVSFMSTEVYKTLVQTDCQPGLDMTEPVSRLPTAGGGGIWRLGVDGRSKMLHGSISGLHFPSPCTQIVYIPLVLTV